ncbi:GNAT family N-acetyltransferase [Glutamicibacter ardleyensis]|uniref:Acetyltransferase n=1 Tax=Glutamicibacter ardleyensis TaxID=225894 RepID=A0ABQ2DE93_9MICC|nr:GNAT family N-acetyltransferase [Glutamicibacter ardleyensis]GGJ54904.1 acetyltransferase [Glutamicibacter ardleyensis]
MRIINSERLIMRPWELDDADFLFDLESRWDTVRFLGPHAKKMTTRCEAVESIIRRRAIDDPIHGIWAVTTRETGHLLGNVLLKHIPLSASATSEPPVEIGWHLHPDAQGAGYATEAASAVMTDAATSGLQTVIAVTDPLNVASQRVCERLGMRLLGVTETYYDERNLLFEKDLSKAR